MKRKFESIAGNKLQKKQLFYPNEKVVFCKNNLKFLGIVKKLDVVRNEQTNENEYLYTIVVEGADIENINEQDLKRL